MTRRKLAIVALFSLAVSGACSKDEKKVEPSAQAGAVAPLAPPASQTAPATTPEEAVPAAANELGDWNNYWPAFQKAAAAKDLAALRALCNIGDGNDAIDERSFSSFDEAFLTTEVLEKLAATAAADVEISTSEPAEEGEIREFSWVVTEMVDGEEMGSGLFFYFKKIDGEYKLFRLLAAG